MEFYHRNRYEEYAAFGLPMEQTLKPVLEDILGAPLVKTIDPFDNEDFLCDGKYIELKSRRDHQDKNEYSSWIFPMCKTLCKDKPVTIFYYWDSDKSLYKIDYDEERFFKDFKWGTPHGSNQNHWFVPRHCWTVVPWEEL